MCFAGTIYAECASLSSQNTCRANVPTCFCFASREESDKVCHISAADQQAPAGCWIADHLRNPLYSLRLNLGCHRRQNPRADIRVYSGSQQIAKGADGRGG